MIDRDMIMVGLVRDAIIRLWERRYQIAGGPTGFAFTPRGIRNELRSSRGLCIPMKRIRAGLRRLQRDGEVRHVNVRSGHLWIEWE